MESSECFCSLSLDVSKKKKISCNHFLANTINIIIERPTKNIIDSFLKRLISTKKCKIYVINSLSNT